MVVVVVEVDGACLVVDVGVVATAPTAEGVSARRQLDLVGRRRPGERPVAALRAVPAGDLPAAGLGYETAADHLDLDRQRRRRQRSAGRAAHDAEGEQADSEHDRTKTHLPRHCQNRVCAFRNLDHDRGRASWKRDGRYRGSGPVPRRDRLRDPLRVARLGACGGCVARGRRRRAVPSAANRHQHGNWRREPRRHDRRLPGTYDATTVTSASRSAATRTDLSTKLSVCSDRLHNRADQTTKNSIVDGFYVSADFATIKGFTVTARERDQHCRGGRTASG